SMPEYVPLVFGPAGSFVRWLSRKASAAFLIASAYLDGLLLVVAYNILLRTRQWNANGLEAEREFRFKQASATYLVLIAYSFSTLAAGFALFLCWNRPGINGTVMWAGMLLSLFIILTFADRLKRRSDLLPSGSETASNVAPVRGWGWSGRVYYN